eukprot:UN15329
MFAYRKPKFWETSYFHKRILGPSTGLLSILGGYYCYKTDMNSDLKPVYGGFSLMTGLMSLYSFFSSNPSDYKCHIPRIRERLFKNRTLSNWDTYDAEIANVLSPMERRDIIFDQSLEDICDSQKHNGFTTDFDQCLEDDVLNNR